MQEALVVRRETHIPAPPAAVFALLTDPRKILGWMGTEAPVPGVLQGLANKELLRYVDYLSTVSGGGYIGSWLHGVIRSQPPGSTGSQVIAAAQQTLLNGVDSKPGTPDVDPIAFLPQKELVERARIRRWELVRACDPPRLFSKSGGEGSRTAAEIEYARAFGHRRERGGAPSGTAASAAV